MSKKFMLLALAAVSAVMFALPAVASARSWDADWNNGNHSAPLVFNVNQTTTTQLTTAGSTIDCTKVTGEGEYTTTTTGNVKLTFSGCTSPPATCTSPSQASGVIVTSQLTFHNIYATHAGKEIPAILITPGANNTFATFSCKFFGIGPEITVTGGGGNGGGVIGEVETCGKGLTKSPLNFVSSSAGNQTLTTWTGKTYDLVADNGGTTETASQDGTGFVEFTQSTDLTC